MKKIAFISVLALAAVFGWYAYSHSQAVPQNLSEYQRVRVEVAALFNGHSSQQAYALFKAENAKKTEQVQHLAAHVVGEFLYEREGVKGFTMCDGEFGFGCFHGFLGSAIADTGVSIVPSLDDACVKAYGIEGLGCSHGIGHGLVSYFGYSARDLVKALNLCSQLSWVKPYGGCRDGVFMEYTFRTMETEGKNRIRDFTYENRHEPCGTVPADSKESCYFSLPAWWAEALKSDANRLSKEGVYCSDVSKTENIRACFRGVGYAEALVVQFNYVPGMDACDTYAGEKRVWCREGLAWAFYADPSLRGHADTICTKDLSSSEVKTCKDEYLFVLQ